MKFVGCSVLNCTTNWAEPCPIVAYRKGLEELIAIADKKYSAVKFYKRMEIYVEMATASS
jgi:hypothetical protein